MPAAHDHSRTQYDPQSLLNSQPVAVAVIDPGTHVVQFQNQTSLTQFGDVAGARCYQKIGGSEGPCRFCRMNEALSTGQIRSSDVALPDDRHLLVHWSKTVTSSGEVRVIETITDVTTQKRLEEALRQSQKMEAVGRMAGGIAHDFNNLLMVINGYTDRVLREFSAHPGAGALQLIKQAGTRAAALTQKLLAFSRQKPVEQSVVSLNQTVMNMKELIIGLIGERIRVTFDLDSRLGHLLIDPLQLEQVLLNLVLNARDAMPAGGRLSIRTSNADLDDRYVADHPGARRGRYVCVAVTDEGCGMDPETQARIFDPFFTTKPPGKGTGLGLTTVYGIVKQSQGYIDVASSPGRGTAFTVYFPRLLEREPAGRALSPGERHGDTIVVVEDEESVRGLVVAILTTSGYRVLEAANGVEGLEVIQRASDDCRLVITDVMMPELTGPAMIERLAARLPGLNVLYMSGYADDLLAAKGLTPRHHFLQKPILPDVLLAKVEALLALS
ncbi:ATP-binding protein [Candidatus Nitrospira bockiana]